MREAAALTQGKAGLHGVKDALAGHPVRMLMNTLAVAGVDPATIWLQVCLSSRVEVTGYIGDYRGHRFSSACKITDARYVGGRGFILR